jgi:hypothetical protein
VIYYVENLGEIEVSNTCAVKIEDLLLSLYNFFSNNEHNFLQVIKLMS